MNPHSTNGGDRSRESSGKGGSKHSDAASAGGTSDSNSSKHNTKRFQLVALKEEEIESVIGE